MGHIDVGARGPTPTNDRRLGRPWVPQARVRRRVPGLYLMPAILLVLSCGLLDIHPVGHRTLIGRFGRSLRPLRPLCGMGGCF